MTTIQERAAATPDEDRWCSTCAGTGVIDNWQPASTALDPVPCPECQGCGWFNAAGAPADPPRPRNVGREILGVLAFFAVLALGGWLIDNFWPAAAALVVVLCIVVWRTRAWTL